MVHVITLMTPTSSPFKSLTFGRQPACRTFFWFSLLSVLLFTSQAWAAKNSFRIDIGTDSPNQVGAAIKMALVLTALSIVPALILTTTCFVRVIVVLSLLKSALGTQTTPPQQVLIGLAIFITSAVMWPVGSRVYSDGLEPYLDGEVNGMAAVEAGAKPLRHFMLRQTREQDLMLFYDISNSPRPTNAAGVEMHLLIPSFVISELRTAFEMGFMLFIPFLLLDMVVAAITMSLGMVMLPPALISMPIKIMLFVLIDGWHLIVGSLVRSYS